MNLLSRAAACCLLALSLAACATSETSAGVTMDTTTVLNTVWNVALTIAAAMLPFVIPLLTQKAAALLKIKSDDALYASLYRTIDNVLKALIASKGIAAVNPAAISGALVSEAIDLVKANNPKAVTQTGQLDEALTTKILAKIPEATVAVASAAKLTSATK